jgi:transglutaminase-like putative cysteine protease
MMKQSWYPVLSVVLVVAVWLAGCQGLPGFSTTYEPMPTGVQYDISYGYQVNSTGGGQYLVTYLCDIPEVLQGSVVYSMLFNHDYLMQTRVNNTMVRWNISGDDTTTFSVGLSSHVQAGSYLVGDLSGNGAVPLDQLGRVYPDVARQYTKPQGNETIVFIDPSNIEISMIAHGIRTTEKTNNTFLLAKALFIWLKTNVHYQAHPGQEGVQPAVVTLHAQSGDCDDLSFLYISLCRSLGIPARFIRGYLLDTNGSSVVTATPHAWVEVFVGDALGVNGWIPVECSCSVKSVQSDMEQNFGVEDVFHLRLFTDDGSNESLALSFSGISYVTYGISRHIQLSAFAEVHNYQELVSQKLVVGSDNIRHYE